MSTTARSTTARPPRPLLLDDSGRVLPSQQTRVASFLISAHGAHARRLALTLAGPVDGVVQVIQHTEYCRAAELVSLFARSTAWSFDPLLPVLGLTWEAAWLPAPVSPAGDLLTDQAIDLLAFGHALYGGIRPATILPADAEPADPFVMAITQLELESSRLIQGQIAVLKSQRLENRRDAIETALGARQKQIRALWADLLADLPQT